MATVTLNYNKRNTNAVNLVNYLRTLDFVKISDNRENVLQDMRQSKIEAEALSERKAKGYTVDEIISMI